jgi:hypothetical protein
MRNEAQSLMALGKEFIGRKKSREMPGWDRAEHRERLIPPLGIAPDRHHRSSPVSHVPGCGEACRKGIAHGVPRGSFQQRPPET